MQTVQLALGTAPYVSVLCDLLVRSEPWKIATVTKPDPKKPDVLVVNEEALDCLPVPIERPERIVCHIERS